MILAHEQEDKERYFFLLKFKWCREKCICILIYLLTVSFVYKNTRTTYSHKHQKITMNNVLTSVGLNTMSFSIICILREHVTSYEFPYNDNKIIILMNIIILYMNISTCSNSPKYLGTLCIYMMYKNLPQFLTVHFQIKSFSFISTVAK